MAGGPSPGSEVGRERGALGVPFEIRSPATGWPIHGDLHPGPGDPAAPLLVLAHDLLGSKDAAFVPYLAGRLAERFPTIRFTFSGAGVEPGETRMTRPERFARNTLTIEREDLREVLRAAATPGLLPVSRGDTPRRVGLVGHGFGGTVSLLEAGEVRAGAVAALAARSSLRLLSEDDRLLVREQGGIEFDDPRSPGARLRMSRPFFEDLERLAEEGSLEGAVSGLSIPLLFLHGEEDSCVPCRESEQLFRWSRKDGARMVLLEKTGHTFGAQEPFEGPTRDLDRVAEILLAFFSQSF